MTQKKIFKDLLKAEGIPKGSFGMQENIKQSSGGRKGPKESSEEGSPFKVFLQQENFPG